MTKIEWTEATWNPVTGCTKISPGCKNCYAERMHKRLRGMGQVKYDHDFNDVHCHPLVLDNIPEKKMIFVCSMSDLFHDDVPIGFIDDVYETMTKHTDKVFQVLTKRHRRMYDYVREIVDYIPMETLSHIWHGGSFCNQDEVDKYMKYVVEIPGITFASLEPMLGPISLRPFDDFSDNGHGRRWLGRSGNAAKSDGINWVIVGGESGPGARSMEIEWVESIVDQCKSANTPVFVKQLHIDGKLVKEINQFPKKLQIREYHNEWTERFGMNIHANHF